jgi:hypothetical protein
MKTREEIFFAKLSDLEAGRLIVLLKKCAKVASVQVGKLDSQGDADSLYWQNFPGETNYESRNGK